MEYGVQVAHAVKRPPIVRRPPRQLRTPIHLPAVFRYRENAPGEPAARFFAPGARPVEKTHQRLP
jgi:hypothetical protein